MFLPSFRLFRTFSHMYHEAQTFNSKGSITKNEPNFEILLEQTKYTDPSIFYYTREFLSSYNWWVNWMERTDRTGVTITSFLQLIKRGSMVEVVLGFFFGVALFENFDLQFWLRSSSFRNRSDIIAFIFAWY